MNPNIIYSGTGRWNLVFLLLVSIILAGCGAGAAEDKDESEEEAAPVIPVEAAEVIISTVSVAYEGTAALEPDEQAEVVAKTTGIALEILAEEGDYVEAGQVIARLEKDSYRLEVAQTQAELNRLSNEFKRNKELYGRKLISTDEYDRSRFMLESQKATNEMANLNLSYTDIRAPIAGYISQRMVKVGNLIQLHQPVYRIDSFDPLLAVLHVPERELNIIRLGEDVSVSFDAYPGELFYGEVTRISPVINPETGTFRVTAELTDTSSRLKTGLFGRIRIVYDRHENTPVVPQDAIITEDGSHSVFVIAEDGSVSRRDVVLGFSTDDIHEVTEGLATGEQVVTAGKGSLRDGATVEVIGG
jgi:membrane fusion protein (multidrug efflux system)